MMRVTVAHDIGPDEVFNITMLPPIGATIRTNRRARMRVVDVHYDLVTDTVTIRAQ
jgi:hypothetical protein